MKEKRNIHELIVREEPHLHEILDPEQVTKFKELTNELKQSIKIIYERKMKYTRTHCKRRTSSS